MRLLAGARYHRVSKNSWSRFCHLCLFISAVPECRAISSPPYEGLQPREVWELKKARTATACSCGDKGLALSGRKTTAYELKSRGRRIKSPCVFVAVGDLCEERYCAGRW